MHHCHRRAVRGGNNVYLLVNTVKWLFEDEHCKYGSACGDVSGLFQNAVRCHHACACVALRRADRHACFEASLRVKESCALLCKNSTLFSCISYRWEDIFQLMVKAFFCKAFFCRLQILFFVSYALHREDT